MPNLYDTYVFDLDETLADSRWIKPERDVASKDHSKRGRVEAQARRNMDPFDGVPELLGKIRSGGGEVVILTNSWKEYAQAALEGMGVAAHVGLLVGSAGKPRYGKLAGIARNRPGSRLVHAGDHVKDLEESVHAEVGFIMCLWGEFGSSKTALTDEQRGVLVGKAGDVAELRRMLVGKRVQPA